MSEILQEILDDVKNPVKYYVHYNLPTIIPTAGDPIPSFVYISICCIGKKTAELVAAERRPSYPDVFIDKTP